MRKKETLQRSIPLLVFMFAAGFSACKKHEKHWSYQDETGPQHWSELENEFASCKTGAMQSPIDISGKTIPGGKPPEFQYAGLKFGVIDNGHTIQANVEGESSILLDGKRYNLVQIHFHSPSENTLNGKSFPMEGHLVHKSEDGALAVVGVFFAEGKNPANTAIASIWSAIPTEKEKLNPSKETMVPSELLPSESPIYRFEGSLTTPPCSEGVKWNVYEKAVTIPTSQIATFRAHYSNNARPVQERKERVITKIGK